MKQWAEIRGNRVRHTFETRDDFTPVFGPPITVVEITGRSPQPEEDWIYDRGADTFAFATRPVPPVDVDADAAQVLVDISGILSAVEQSDALKLLLSKAYGL